MTFDIVAEAHSGVIDCDEEVVAKVIEASDAADALRIVAEQDPRIRYIKNWDCYVFGLPNRVTRKVTAIETKGTNYG